MNKEIFEYKTTPKSRHNRYRTTRWVNCMDSRRNTILLESHGILNSFTQDFDRITRRYVKNNICPILTIDDETRPDTAIPDISTLPLFKRFVFYAPCDWVDEVNLYITTSFGEDAFLLCDDGEHKYNIFYDGKIMPSYKLEGTHIKYMSIVISSDLRDVNEYKITTIIKHEMMHGYELIRKKFMANDLNRDIQYFYTTLQKSDISFVTKYYNYTDKQIKDFITSLNAEEIYALLRDMIYYLNSSEMSARLVNFDSDIDNLLRNQNSDEFGSTSIGIYLGLKNVMQGLNQYITPQDKKTFSEQHMIEFNKIYGYSDNPRLFKHYGKFDERSFNYLTAFFLKKINTFIYKCHSIYTSKCGGHMPHSLLSWQNVLYISAMNTIENINNKN